MKGKRVFICQNSNPKGIEKQAFQRRKIKLNGKHYYTLRGKIKHKVKCRSNKNI